MSAEEVSYLDALTLFHSKITPELFNRMHSGERGEEIVKAGYVDSGYDSIVVRIGEPYVGKIYDDENITNLYKLEMLQRYKTIINKFASLTRSKNITVTESTGKNFRLFVNPILWLGYSQNTHNYLTISPFVKGTHASVEVALLVDSTIRGYQQSIGVLGVQIDPRNMKHLDDDPGVIIITDLGTSINTVIPNLP